MGRLTSATIIPQSGSPAIVESYTYSATGNILSKTDASGTKTYAYGDGRHPHAVTKFGNDTYAYDAAGNMVSETRVRPPLEGGTDTIAYGYDGFNRLASITNAAGTTTYAYGSAYDRVQKIKVTTYLGELSEVDETGAYTPTPNKLMFYVYVLKSSKDSALYIGSTNNLKTRFEAHNKGKVPSTRSRTPFVLVYYEAYKAEQDARHREHNLKLRANALSQMKRRISRSIKEV